MTFPGPECSSLYRPEWSRMRPEERAALCAGLSENARSQAPWGERLESGAQCPHSLSPARLLPVARPSPEVVTGHVLGPFPRRGAVAFPAPRLSPVLSGPQTAAELAAPAPRPPPGAFAPPARLAWPRRPDPAVRGRPAGSSLGMLLWTGPRGFAAALCTERLYPLSWQAELRPRLACRERRRPGRARYVA